MCASLVSMCASLVSMCACSCSVYVTSSRSLLWPWEYRQYMPLKCPFTRQHGVITRTPTAGVLPNGQLFKWDFLFTVQPKCLCNATSCCWCSSPIRNTRCECRNVGHHSLHSVLFVTSHSVYSSSSSSLPPSLLPSPPCCLLSVMSDKTLG